MSIKKFIRKFFTSRKLTPKWSAFRISLIYLAYGVLWILTTDRLLELMVGGNYELYNKLQTYKGGFYVALTAAFIFALVQRTLKLYEEAKQRLITTNDELKKQFEKTLVSEKRFELAVKGSSDSIWEYDGLSERYFMSDTLLINMGYSKDEFKLKNLEDWIAFIVEEDRAMFIDYVAAFSDVPSESFLVSYRVYRKDASIAWIRTKGSAQISETGKIMKVAGSHTDISLFINHQEELKKIAYYDRLTGLLNWHGFRLEVQKHIENNPNVSFTLLYLDIDDFKNINDFYGYGIGDKLLIEISRSITKKLTDHTYLANLGGDGFGFLIETVEQERVLKFIESTYTVLGSIKAIEKRQIEVSACIGLAQYPKDAKGFDELMQCADEAMFDAKNKGKNTFVFFSDELHHAHLQKIDLTSTLRKAVDKNELFMMYQPIYDLKTKEIISLEALLRWRPYGKELVSPDLFIPLAETSGLIGKIELWVFEEVFKQIVAWRQIRSRHIPIAINLSSKGLTNDVFIEQVIQLMKRYDIKAGEVEIEITETSLIEHQEAALASLRLLSGYGIKILLDDFGKGYSSLTYLVSLPIDLIKIDRGFTQKIHSSQEIDSVITTIIDLAHSIHLLVIAEGIEYENQADFLSLKGADYGQGYLLHYPSLPKDLEDLLR
jgi:diguanylate cyclase (GGDEF)-like protein